MRLTGRQTLVYGLAAVFLSAALALGALLAADVYFHHRFAEFAGLNIWGYRGPTVGQKQPREWRVFVLGGSTTFGYGVGWRDAFPAVLERRLQDEFDKFGITVRVLNLGYHNEGAFSFRYTLRDYEHLQPDVVVLYSGYNDLAVAPNRSVYRHTSPLFRLTGYMPILPIVLVEKAMSLRYGGDLEAAYQREKTTFQPNLAIRTSAAALETAAAIARSLERQLGTLTETAGEAPVTANAGGCHGRFAAYCDSVASAVQDVLDRGRDAVVVSEPYIADVHVDQQRAVHQMLGQRFGTGPRLSLVDLGPAVDLKDPRLAFDTMHLTARGNRVIADALVPVIGAILETRARPGR